jgi:hypothetical protein
MYNYKIVECLVEGEDKKYEGHRVINPGLYITEKGRSTKIVGAPVWNRTFLKGACKKILHRIKPSVDISE